MSDTKDNSVPAGQPEERPTTPPPAAAPAAEEEPPVVCTCAKDTCAVPQPSHGHGSRRRGPLCCCEGVCTCPPRRCGSRGWRHHSHSHSRSPCRHMSPHHSDPTSSGEEHWGRGRRCPYCLPERAAVEEADLMGRRQRCQSARAERQARYDALRAPHGGYHESYRTNTAERLRASRGSDYQRAVDAELQSRREELRAELAARRSEIDSLRRQNASLRAAGFGHGGRSRHGSCSPRRNFSPPRWGGRRCRCMCSPSSSDSSSSRGPRWASCGRSRSPTHGRCGRPMPPHCRSPHKRPPSPGHWGKKSPHHGPCGKKMPPPPPHCHPWQGFGHGFGGPKCPAFGPWGHKTPPHHNRDHCRCEGTCACPAPCRCPPHHHRRMTPPSPHRHGPCHGMPPPMSRPWAHSPPHCHSPHKRPPSPGHWGKKSPPHGPCGKKMPPPPPHCHPWQGFGHGFGGPKCPPFDSCGKKTPPPPRPHGHGHGPCRGKRPCPSCGHPLFPTDAADVVAMLANKDFAKLCKCPSCGFVAGAPHPAARADSQRGRSHSPCSPRSHSTGLAAPRYGRKVFITDDAYLDRRASRLSAWERAGAISREPATTRSPSAPLPERTPKWRTVDSARSLNAEVEASQ